MTARPRGEPRDHSDHGDHGDLADYILCCNCGSSAKQVAFQLDSHKTLCITMHKKMASNSACNEVVRLQSSGWEVGEELQAAIDSGDVTIGWHMGPAPAAVSMPCNTPYEKLRAELAIRYRPLVPYCKWRGEEGKPLTGVEGWPEEEEAAESKPETHDAREYTARNALEDTLVSILAELADERVHERAMEMMDDIHDYSEEQATEKHEEIKALLKVAVAETAEDAQRQATVAREAAARQPYSGPARADARSSALSGAEASRAADDAWAAEATGNRVQTDIRDHAALSLPKALESRQAECVEETEELGIYKSNTNIFRVLGHAEALIWQQGEQSAPDLSEDMLQAIPKSTAANPSAGTKTYPWLVLTATPERGVDMPPLDELYEKMKTDMGNSIQYLGVNRTEVRAVGLIKKTKTRNLIMPTLPEFHMQLRSINWPRGKGGPEIEKYKCLFLAAWLGLQGDTKTAITLTSTQLEVKNASTAGAYSTAREAYDLVKDMKSREFAFFCADLKVKVKQGEELRAVENTVLVIRTDLEHLRDNRARARSFVRVLGEDGIDLTFPESFIASRLGAIKGTMRDVGAGKDRPCSIYAYVNSPLHLKLTAILWGPPEVGKSPLAEAMAARFAQMYQDGDEENYIVTSTPDSLRLLADEDMLVEGVPIIFEELENKDRKSHARPLTANAMKHLCGVKDGGVMSARYRDFALSRKQPRIICVNSCPQDWLDAITDDARDQEALRKRVIFFEVAEPVITSSSNDSLEIELSSFFNDGFTRLESKLRRR